MSPGHMQEYVFSALSRCSQESYLSYVYVHLTLISAIFQAVLAVLKQVRNREREDRTKGKQRKNSPNGRNCLIALGACFDWVASSETLKITPLRRVQMVVEEAPNRKYAHLLLLCATWYYLVI